MVTILRLPALSFPLLFAAVFLLEAISQATPLDDYIDSADPSYEYTHVQTINRVGYSGYVLEMTSQTWRSPSEVDRTLWKHWVTIVVPATYPIIPVREKALMVVVGADNDDPYDAAVVDYLAPIALAEQAVVIAVEMVPNQPLLFADQSAPRSSDAIIAYSWDKYFTTNDPTWIAQLPMTKSVVRAMDSVQDFCDNLPAPITITDFVVSGASKHGWTTWLSAIVDNRVSGIIPIVIDLLNLDASFKHHFAAYGFWAPAVSDYEDAGIFTHINSPEMDDLISIIDPYQYRDQVTIPRFIVNSAGDEFFLPDSSNLYYANLPPIGSRTGGKYLRYIPNAGHSLNSTATVETLSMYFHAVLSGVALPQFAWSFAPDGTIEVQAGSQQPSSVKLWQATNPDKRDFRYSEIGNSWTSSNLNDQGGGRYIGAISEPPNGWTAYFVEVSYPSSGLFDYTFTTDIRVAPTFLPWEADIDFDGEIEGDVNGDGFVTLADAIQCLRVVSGVQTPAQTEADYDGDRRIGIGDCIYILDSRAL